MAKQTDLGEMEFLRYGDITLTKLNPPNRTHVSVTLGSTTIVLHMESWSPELHLEAIRRFDRMVIELRAFQQALNELHNAPTTPTSSCS